MLTSGTPRGAIRACLCSRATRAAALAWRRLWLRWTSPTTSCTPSSRATRRASPIEIGARRSCSRKPRARPRCGASSIAVSRRPTARAARPRTAFHSRSPAGPGLGACRALERSRGRRVACRKCASPAGGPTAHAARVAGVRGRSRTRAHLSCRARRPSRRRRCPRAPLHWTSLAPCARSGGGWRLREEQGLASSRAIAGNADTGVSAHTHETVIASTSGPWRVTFA